MLRTGQADVEQARVLGVLLVLPGGAGSGPFRFRHIEVPMQATLAAGTVMHHATTTRRRRLAADAHERQEHQRIFKPLALVQGDDLHAARVGFQAQQLRLVVGIGIGDALAQPVDQAVQAQRIALRFLQQLGQLQVIADAPLAVQQAEQAFAIAGAEIIDERQRTAAQQAFAPAHRALLPVAVRVGIGLELVDAECVHADQHGGQRGAQAAVIATVQQGEQQHVQVACFAGGEQALLAGRHRGDADQRQRLLDHRGLAMRTHQHRDVAGLHGFAFDQRLASTGVGQHRMDRGGAGMGGEFARFARSPRLLLALVVDRWRGRTPDRQCGCGLAIAQKVVVATLVAGLDRAEFDARIDEGGIARVGVERGDGAQHRRTRTEVVRQRGCGRGDPCRREVGVHIATTKPVDRLLGIADHEQCGLRAPAAEQPVEDRPLARVGVLELIDQRDGVLRAQLARERARIVMRQRIGDAIDQVVVGLHAALPLEQRQAHARIIAETMQQVAATAHEQGVQYLHCIQVVRYRSAHVRRGRRPVRVAFLGACHQCTRAQFFQLRVRRAGQPGVVGERLQPLAQVGKPRLLVLPAMHHVGINRRGQRIQEVFAVVVPCLLQRTLRLQHVALHGLDACDQALVGNRRQQHRLAQQCRQILREVFEATRPQRGQVIRTGRVLRMQAPQVGGEFRAQVAVIGQQGGGIETLPAFQRMFAQHACAEAVDGEDRGQVGFQRGLAQATAQRVLALVAVRAMRFQQLPGQHGFRAVTAGLRCIEHIQRELQALADALAQFLRGRLGEGDRQDLADAQAAFDHQPRHQRGQGEGLAGAGAGLDQLHAIERDVEIRIACVAHAASSDSSSGNAVSPSSIAIGMPRVAAPKTMPLMRAKSSNDAASANGSRPRRARRIASLSLSAQPRSLPRHLPAAFFTPLATSSRAANNSQPL